MSEISIQTSDTLPAVAPQQPANATPEATKIDAFRNAFAILHNLDRDELAGIVTSDDGWKRFNNNLTTFVLKLDDNRLAALWALVQERQPARYRG